MNELTKQELQFNDLLMGWNTKVNLVSRKKENVYDLIINSRIFLDYIPKGKGKLIDIGTGGGFPGIVIKLHRPMLDITLVDSIQKKITAVSDIIKNLKLKRIDAVCARAEQLSLIKKHFHAYDYAAARSVAPLDELAGYASGLLGNNGRLITIKGKEVCNEIESMRRLYKNIHIEIYNLAEDRKAVIITFN
jgi:16S rRNA (guanine527-N7)-methyltransferase